MPYWASVRSSAAAEGVGAWRSAAASAMVVSVAWPMPVMTGREQACDGAGDDLGVEAVEVFPGAAATGYEDYVGVVGVVGEPADAGGDFGGAVGALDGGGVDEEVDGGVAAAADLDDVAEGGALQAGDDSDAVGEGGEGALAVEEAFAAEFFFELLGWRRGGRRGRSAAWFRRLAGAGRGIRRWRGSRRCGRRRRPWGGSGGAGPGGGRGRWRAGLPRP
jgi:hypothetical protein